jgi:signal transduction histidine kinase
LVNDLLDTQKLDLKKINFSYENIDVVYLLVSLISNISNAAKQKNAEIVNSSKQNFVIESDRNRLEQVLNNLIYNAIDFVPKFTGRIEINATKNNSAAIFYVKDNGPGIEPAKHKDIFKKFYQTDTSATRKHGGSGLGLSICQGIVEGLGGKIWLESEVGKGTTFYFKIPLSSKHI